MPPCRLSQKVGVDLLFHEAGNGCVRRIGRADLPAVPVVKTQEDLRRYIHDMWIKYFTFLLQNSHKTLFYFKYRSSKYDVPETAGDHTPPCFDSARAFIKQHAHSKFQIGYCKMYLFDVTSSFAKRMIAGELSTDSQSTELIWSLLWSGMSHLVKSREDL